MFLTFLLIRRLFYSSVTGLMCLLPTELRVRGIRRTNMELLTLTLLYTDSSETLTF